MGGGWLGWGVLARGSELQSNGGKLCVIWSQDQTRFKALHIGKNVGPIPTGLVSKANKRNPLLRDEMRTKEQACQDLLDGSPYARQGPALCH